jgi:hypothetical protein
MLGYLKDAKLGAAIYDLVHTLVSPMVLLLVALLMPNPANLPYALIWFSHRIRPHAGLRPQIPDRLQRHALATRLNPYLGFLEISREARLTRHRRAA